MARRTTSLFAGLGLVVLLGGALAGCATDTTADPGASTDPTQDAATEIEVDGAWLEGGHAIGVITQGSSTCVPTVSDVALGDDGVVAVTLVDADADAMCTRDLVPRVSLAALPEGVDATKDLTVDVAYAEATGSVTLPGIAGLEASEPNVEGAPSAGWTSVNGEFVIVTYGSSSCPALVENTEVSGEDAVTVTFVTPPADQVCTMDYAPRAVLAFADGLADQPNVTLSLVGDNLDATDIPILGANYVATPIG